MKRFTSVLLVSALLVLGAGVNTANASKPSGPCKKAGVVKVVGDVGYKCSKKGKKFVWKKVFVAPAEDLKAARDGSQILYSWVSVNQPEKILHFELGVSILKDTGSSPTLISSFTKPKVFSLATGSQTSIGLAELKSYLERQTLNPAGQAALVRVRVITNEGASTWSNGIYTFYESLSTVSPPPATQSPTPPPPATQSPTPPTSAPVQSTPTSTVKTFYGFDYIGCPSGSVVSGGLGTIPQTVWSDLFRSPLDTVTHRTATFFWHFGGRIAQARGIAIIYVRQNNGSFVAPNGARYYELGRGSWSVPVWISCRVSS